MTREEGFKSLEEYLRGMMSGERTDFDVVKTRALDALRRQPLALFLADLALAGLKIRGTIGNKPVDVIDLLEQVREQSGVSKQELARRSGVSRGHIIALRGENANPMLETIVRLAIGLDFPLEIVSQGARHVDDEVEAAPDPGMTDQAAHAQERPAWGQIGVFGATMATATLLPQAFARPGTTAIGCGALGAASLGVAMLSDNRTVRVASGLVAAGLLTGAAVGGVVAFVRSRRGTKPQGEDDAR